MSSVQFVLGASADIASSDEVRSAVKDGTDTIMGRLSASARWKGNRRRIPASVNNPVAATGTWVLDFGSPQGNYVWWIVDTVITAGDDRTAPGAAAVANQTSNFFGAGLLGVLALPVLGESLSGFVLNFQAPVGAVNIHVIVSNVAGGNQDYMLSIPAGGVKDLTVNFPAPIAALNSGVAPTITVPVTAGGPAYSITMFGQTVATGPAVATLYAGNPARQATATTVADMPLLGQLVRPAASLPALFTFHKETWPVHDGENLFAVVYSPTAALTVISAVATVMELDASNIMLSRG